MSEISFEEYDYFTIVDNKLAKDPNLSWKAKGLYLYLVSNSKSFKIYKTEVVKHAKDGKESTRTAWKELEDAGWIVSTKIKGDDGRFAGWSHKVMTKGPIKKESNRDTENPNVGNHDVRNHDVSEHDTNKQQYIINNNSNKKQENTTLSLDQNLDSNIEPRKPERESLSVDTGSLSVDTNRALESKQAEVPLKPAQPPHNSDKPEHKIFAMPERKDYDPNELWAHFKKHYERLGHAPGNQWGALQSLSALSNEDAVKCRESIEKLVDYKLAEKKRDKWTSNLPTVVNFIKQKRYLDDIPVLHIPGDYSNMEYTQCDNGTEFGAFE